MCSQKPPKMPANASFGSGLREGARMDTLLPDVNFYLIRVCKEADEGTCPTGVKSERRN